MATKWKAGDMVLVPAAAIIAREHDSPAVSLGTVFHEEPHDGGIDGLGHYAGSILVDVHNYYYPEQHFAARFWCRPELLSRPRDD